MPVTLVYPPYAALAALVGILFAVFCYIYLQERRAGPRRRKATAALVLAVTFAVATGGLAFAAYAQYEEQNTWTYFFEVDVEPNSTATQAIVVPVPQDPALLAGLHAVSGAANWSYADTIHGRGLYVQFAGPATLESTFSERWSTGSDHDSSLTLANSTTPVYGGSVWVYCLGTGGLTLHLQAGYAVSNGSPVLAAGWNLVMLVAIP